MHNPIQEKDSRNYNKIKTHYPKPSTIKSNIQKLQQIKT